MIRRPARNPTQPYRPHRPRRIARLRTPRRPLLYVSCKRLARRPSIGWTPALWIVLIFHSDLTETSFLTVVFDWNRSAPSIWLAPRTVSTKHLSPSLMLF